jgi:hypothetical protein
MSDVQTPQREITIYATRGGQMKKIMTNVSTWGELQPLVRAEGFDLSSLLAAENINKSDLVNDLAVLPATAFRLFLRPKQTKSGALDRKECFAVIKAHLAANPGDKPKFTVDGKNVTQLATAVVQDLVAKYCKGAAVAQKVSEPVKEVVATLPTITTKTDLTDAEKVEEALSLVSTLKDYDSYYKVLKHLGKLRFEITGEQEETEESEENAIRREAKEMGY